MSIKKDIITVILTAYKRDHFDLQIPAILEQSIKPDKIYIWQNENHVDLSFYKQKYQNSISIIKSETNFKFWGRFALATLFSTEYVAIFDDDIIPGPKWLENCLRLSKEKNCIIGANGRTINNTNIDLDSPDIEAAFVGHCWFFKKEWLHYMYAIEPYTYENGEDIHFCACCKILGGITSWVPEQFGDFNSTLKDFGDDSIATCKTSNHSEIRKKIIDHFKLMGWK